jgi:hypothetical protein
MQLTKALREIIGREMGTFLSCIPGKLGYFENEMEDAFSSGEKGLSKASGALSVSERSSFHARGTFFVFQHVTAYLGIHCRRLSGCCGPCTRGTLRSD